MNTYSQKPLIELMKAGAFPEETSVPKHVETVISNVFIFDKVVYKFYKNDNDFFNKGFRDISGNDARFAFTEKDYQWNSTLSPSIYIKLANVIVRDGVITEVDSREAAQEVMIVMNKIDTHDVLFEKLITGKIGRQDAFEIGKQLGESLQRAQKPLENPPSFSLLFEDRVKDLREWMSSVPEDIPKEEVDRYCDYLDTFRIDHKELFEGALTSEVTTDGDFHSHNAVYSDGQFLLMDTYPPKEEWGLGHRAIALYRIAVDIWGLTGTKDYFEAVIEGYESVNEYKVDRSLDKLYVVYVAGIAVSYLYMLQKSDGEKGESTKVFHAFLRDYFGSLA